MKTDNVSSAAPRPTSSAPCAKRPGARGVRDILDGGEISIPVDDLYEPSFRRGQGGNRDLILPGNKDFVEGDKLQRPKGGEGSGNNGGSDGESEDTFRFVLTREEFLDLFLEDLELPDLEKRRVTHIAKEGIHRAGYSVSGTPSNLALTRTMRHAMARRIALKRPSLDEIAALEAEAEAAKSAKKREALWAEVETLRARFRRVPISIRSICAIGGSKPIPSRWRRR